MCSFSCGFGLGGISCIAVDVFCVCLKLRNRFNLSSKISLEEKAIFNTICAGNCTTSNFGSEMWSWGAQDDVAFPYGQFASPLPRSGYHKPGPVCSHNVRSESVSK